MRHGTAATSPKTHHPANGLCHPHSACKTSETRRKGGSGHTPKVAKSKPNPYPQARPVQAYQSAARMGFLCLVVLVLIFFDYFSLPNGSKYL